MAKRQVAKPNGGTLRGVDPLKSSEREFAEAMSYMVDYMTRYIKNNVIGGLHKSTVDKFADSELISFPVQKYKTVELPYQHLWYEDSEGCEYDVYSVGEFTDGLTLKSEKRVRKQTFKDGVLWKDLSVSDIKRNYGITDAKQVGNYATVFLKLNKAAQKKLLKRFDDKRLEKLARQVLEKVNRRNAQQFYGNVESSIGISAKELLTSEGLQSNINALILETAQWAKKLRDETLEMYTSNTLRVMAQGGSLEDLLSQFSDMEEKRKNHAKMVARTQVSTFNSLVGKARAENLGIEKAVWVTSRDERVRRCHQVRDGKEFDLNKGLYASCDGKTLLPGVDYQCRCTYRFVIPKE